MTDETMDESTSETEFYLYRKRFGGNCGYSLGCGSLDLLCAKTLEDAIEESTRDYELDGEGEQKIAAAMIFAAPVRIFALPEMRRERQKREAAERSDDEEAKERAEFERLRQKFGR